MPDLTAVGHWMLRQPPMFDVLADMIQDMNEILDTATYSVSYRQRWWKRRRYACGYVSADEALRTARDLTRLGYRRIRIEVSNQDSGSAEVAPPRGHAVATDPRTPDSRGGGGAREASSQESERQS